MKEQISSMLAEAIAETYGIIIGDMEKRVEIPPDAGLGDYSLPCFTLAKELKKNPKAIAEELKQKAEEKQEEQEELHLSRVQVIGGYLNLFLDREFYVSRILGEAWKPDFGASAVGTGKTICMDYSSPNIAKKFHVGHLRNTVIGNSLYQIFSRLGYQVIRINYLGDWGTQFGKLIAAYRLWSSKQQVEEEGIAELLRIYIKFDQEAACHPQLEEEARVWFARMERGRLHPRTASPEEEESLAIWKWFKEISLKEYDRVYSLLKVGFDSSDGESFYMDKVPALVEELKEKNLLEESEGANIISLKEYGMPPCLITKKDGSSIYHSRDIAAAIYRKQTYDFAQCLYVTGMEQKLHFAQVFQALELMGYEWAGACRHIPYGLVSLGGEKLSTRKGNIIYAEDILREAVSRAQKAILEKNPQIPNREDTASKIGIGAVIFHDLSNQLSRDVSFQWEEVLNFDGMTAPYIQYTFARASSILRKADHITPCINKELLTDDVSYSLLRQIGNYPGTIEEAAEKCEPCIVARYAYQLAVMFNRFYQECRIIDGEKEMTEARIALTFITRKVIGDAMSLLGIECPEEM